MAMFVANYISAFADNVKKSSDGGSSWANLPLSPAAGSSPFALFVSADETVIVVGANNYVYRSINAGISWALVLTPTGSCQDLSSSPTDENKLWICSAAGYVYYSDNMGASWVVKAAPAASGMTAMFSISFASDTVGWALGYSAAVGSGHIRKTTDGGATWSAPQLTGFSGSFGGSILAVTTLLVYCVDVTIGAGNCFVTVDGSTWTGYPTLRAYSGADLSALGAKVWFTGRSGTTIEINYSLDYGQTWYRATVVDTYSPTFSRVPIRFVTANVGYLFGYYCYKSSDGGQTWNQLGICAYSSTQTPYSAWVNAVFVIQFRSFDVTGVEPTDRTTQGSVISGGNPLNFGEVGGGNNSNVKVIIFRVLNMGAYATLSNMRFWLQAKALVGSNNYYCDITDTWTQNKTPAQVAGGTPGTCPQSLPGVANLTKIGGGDITGTGHSDTSQYIYLCQYIGDDEIGGDDISLNYRCNFTIV